MNKLTKVGCSALCGSLAAISAANAGDMTVTGGVDMSWISLDNNTTGNPIGMGSNLTFKGSGELDIGWTFDYTVAMLNQDAYSSAAVSINMGGLGKLNINQGDSGNGIDAYDDKMPTAWEEPWGNGLSTGIQLVTGVGTSNNMQYTTPTMLGITLTGALAPQAGSADTGDKGSGGVSAGAGKIMDGVININPSMGTEILSGLDMFVGASVTENYDNADATPSNNKYEAVSGITYDIGPLSLGFGKSGIQTGETTSTTGVDFYRNTMYGVALNINDDLSLSYGFQSSRKHFVNPDSGGQVSTTEVESYQISYTMGGASLRVAETKGKNLSYSQGNDKDATVVSLSLAF